MSTNHYPGNILAKVCPNEGVRVVIRNRCAITLHDDGNVLSAIEEAHHVITGKPTPLLDLLPRLQDLRFCHRPFGVEVTIPRS